MVANTLAGEFSRSSCSALRSPSLDDVLTDAAASEGLTAGSNRPLARRVCVGIAPPFSRSQRGQPGRRSRQYDCRTHCKSFRSARRRLFRRRSLCFIAGRAGGRRQPADERASRRRCRGCRRSQPRPVRTGRLFKKRSSRHRRDARFRRPVQRLLAGRRRRVRCSCGSSDAARRGFHRPRSNPRLGALQRWRGWPHPSFA